VHLAIEPAGYVSRVAIEGALPPDLGACLEHTSRWRGRFGGGAASVTLPIDCSPDP
jgi:hypothetical protein